MSEQKVITMRTNNAAETEKLGEQIGKRLRGGEVIELVSDLGGGKTTFVRGLARGFGSTAHVSSPTFTISQEYKAGERTLYHFDFYRLHESGIVANELSEVAHDPDAVVVVEWGDIVADVLPADRVTITIRATSVDEREFTFALPATRHYLLAERTT